MPEPRTWSNNFLTTGSNWPTIQINAAVGKLNTDFNENLLATSVRYVNENIEFGHKLSWWYHIQMLDEFGHIMKTSIFNINTNICTIVQTIPTNAQLCIIWYWYCIYLIFNTAQTNQPREIKHHEINDTTLCHRTHVTFYLQFLWWTADRKPPPCAPPLAASSVILPSSSAGLTKLLVAFFMLTSLT